MSNKKSDFWYYTRSERRATLALLITSIVIFLLPAIYQFRPLEQTEIDTQAFLQAAAALDALQAHESAAPVVASSFYFNPNTADQEVLISLGLPAATAQTIINYREKVGPFQQIQDLEKIYNLSEADYRRLAPYVRIRNTRQQASTKQQVKKLTVFSLFSFDPNLATREELLQLGLSGKVATTLVRYREKGGQFRRKEDLQKIYGVKPEDYQRLKDYIIIPGSGRDTLNRNRTIASVAEPGAKAVPTAYVSNRPQEIDINRAGAADWQRVPGIGPVISGRIVKFRDKLGGFSHIDQVAQTYGLPDSTFQRMRPYLQLSPLVRRVMINIADAKALQTHPYIKWQQAKVLVAYREEHGPYQSPDDLRKVRALDETFIENIAPYLQFDTP